MSNARIILITLLIAALLCSLGTPHDGMIQQAADDQAATNAAAGQ
jgi:hypothetical protein